LLIIKRWSNGIYFYDIYGISIVGQIYPKSVCGIYGILYKKHIEDKYVVKDRTRYHGSLQW
jgi:hypothetical protein